MNAQPLRVCYFGTYRANYSRNQIMIEGLRCNGVEVIECHETLWHGIEDRVQTASGGWLHPSFVCRVARVYWRLLKLDEEGRRRIAVNLRLAEQPEAVSAIPIEHFDGLDTFEDLGPDGRCVRDYWA